MATHCGWADVSVKYVNLFSQTNSWEGSLGMRDVKRFVEKVARSCSRQRVLPQGVRCRSSDEEGDVSVKYANPRFRKQKKRGKSRWGVVEMLDVGMLDVS